MPQSRQNSQNIEAEPQLPKQPGLLGEVAGLAEGNLRYTCSNSSFGNFPLVFCLLPRGHGGREHSSQPLKPPPSFTPSRVRERYQEEKDRRAFPNLKAHWNTMVQRPTLCKANQHLPHARRKDRQSANT